MIDFFLPMDEIPKGTHQQKGVRVVHGKPFFYTKQSIEDAKHFYAACLKMHRPAEPIKEAVALTVNFFYPVKRPHKCGEPKVTRPDTDNLIKLVKDVMTDLGYWVDDSQIVCEHITKSYSDPSGVRVRIQILDKQGNEVI